MAANTAQIVLTASDKTQAAFASAQKNLDSMAASASRFNGMLAGIGLGVSVQSIGQMADDYTNLQARLKLASRSTEEFAAANEAVQRIAAASAAPLLETATLYTRIAASLKDTNVSQGQMVDTTEAVALSLRISGASAGEASSAMLQFSQAMASGVLRGEEFNAVNESAPRLMQALASSLGVTVGNLRDMAKEGQLTRDVLINGLANELPKLRAEAESLPKTFGVAFTELKNFLLLTVGQMNEATGSSKTLADTLVEIGKPAIITTFQTLGVVVSNTAFVFKVLANDAISSLTAIGYAMTLQFDMAKKTLDNAAMYAQNERKALDDLQNKLLDIKAEAAKPVPDSATGGGGGLLSTLISPEDAKKLQATLAKAFDTKPLDDFVASFKDKAASIKAEYAKLNADMSLGNAPDNPTGFDIRSGVVKGREALVRGDLIGAKALAERNKDMLKTLAQQGAPGFETADLSNLLRDFELEINKIQEKTATTTRDAFVDNLNAAKLEIEKMDPLHVPIAAEAIANDIKAAIEIIRKDLAANPIAIPTVVQSQADISRAATKLGAR